MNQRLKNTILMLKDKKILIVGLGREGKSTLDFLVRNKITDKIYLADKKPEALKEYKSIYTCFVCEYYFEIDDSFDYIFRSPGINPKLIKTKGEIVSQTIIATKVIPEKIIGITGTKGKSTTTTILNYLLNKEGYKSVLSGNIGKPFFDSIEEETDYIVYEMSSHQLMDIKNSPNISIFLNVYPEHLDYYDDYNQYFMAKVNIGKYQKENSTFVYCTDSKEAFLASEQSKAKKTSYSLHKKADIYSDNKFVYVFDKRIKYKAVMENYKLIGDHNLLNLFAAFAVLYSLDIELDINNLSGLKGLPHRLEYAGYYNNIHFYNDSISTIPETAIMGIKALKEVDSIILGGFDRGVSYESLVNYIINAKIEKIVLIPETGYNINKLLQDKGVPSSSIYLVETLKEAVVLAKGITKKDGVCLFSPAAASFNSYKNFEQRGNAFKKYLLA